MGLPWQAWVHAKYSSRRVQILVAALIGLNFLVSASEAQLRPRKGDPAAVVYRIFEWAFGLVFLAELAFNMYGSWFWEFWTNAWNWFDFFIVLISVASLVFDNLPGIGVLRLFRAFRVFRLFKRIKSLRMILEACLKSLPGVSNVFAILGIIMAIWAIMGVEFFGLVDDNEVDYDVDFFRNFFMAMFTLFQIWSGDSWCSGIARPIIQANGNLVIGTVFFVSFFFINGLIMTNAVVAVLCEGFMRVVNEIEAHDDRNSIVKEECAVMELDGMNHQEQSASCPSEAAASGDPSSTMSQVEEPASPPPPPMEPTMLPGWVPAVPTPSAEEALGMAQQRLTPLDLDLEVLHTPVHDVLKRVKIKIESELEKVRLEISEVRILARSLVSEGLFYEANASYFKADHPGAASNDASSSTGGVATTTGRSLSSNVAAGGAAALTEEGHGFASICSNDFETDLPDAGVTSLKVPTCPPTCSEPPTTTPPCVD